jgi:hypothetical protein
VGCWQIADGDVLHEARQHVAEVIVQLRRHQSCSRASRITRPGVLLRA